MNVLSSLTLGVLGAVILSFLITQWVILKAIKHGIVDKPRADRFHTKTTALMGGIAIMITLLISVSFLHLVPFFWGLGIAAGVLASVSSLFRNRYALSYVLSAGTVLGGAGALYLMFPDTLFEQRYAWLMVGASIMFFTGMYDDKSKAMEPKVKLFFQIVATAIACVFVGNANFLPAPISYVFCFVWIVGIINAFNLIDNMNGLSPGVACLTALIFGALSIFEYDMLAVGVLCFLLGGVLVGFLPFNFPNAKVFMGDSGSMLLGYIMATVAITISWDQPAFDLSLLLPIGLLAYPIFDVALVSVNRTRSGRPIYVGGKDHSSHLLVKSGLSPKNAVLLIYGLVIATSVLAYVATVQSLLFSSVCMLVILGVFGGVAYKLTKLHDQEYMPKMGTAEE